MKGLNIVSGDVVEVAPAYDHAGEAAGEDGRILHHVLRFEGESRARVLTAM